MSGPAQNIHNIYDPLWEHDACGIGAVVNLKGTPSHATVDSALKIVAPVFALLGVLVPLAVYRSVSEATIVERLREVD